jgi:hypothetical protein
MKNNDQRIQPVMQCIRVFPVSVEIIPFNPQSKGINFLSGAILKSGGQTADLMAAFIPRDIS